MTERAREMDGTPGTAPRREGLLYLLAFTLAWVLLPLALQTVPHADNIEQFAWAHQVQWGYVKHPPLPTWLLAGGEALFGPSALLTYALAMACVAVTLLLLWQAARLVLDERGALLVLLATSADYYLMGRGSFLNHNTVMLPFVAASAWAVLRLLRAAPAALRPDYVAWLVLGLAQGAGLLTKYQMAVVILANGLALLAGGAARAPGFARGVAVAALATLLPLLPHLAWLREHDFSSFGYAGQNLLAALPPLQRVSHTAGFLLQQVGRLLPAAVLLGVLIAWQRRSGAQADPAAAVLAPPLRRSLALLAWIPLATVVVLALVAGTAPQNHWGASTTLLLPFWAVTALAARGSALPPPRRAFVVAAAVQALAIAWNIAAAYAAPAFHHEFPARALAAQAQVYWHEHAPGEPRILIGPDWETGALALAMPGAPEVIASGQRGQAPWIADADLAACGALVFWRPQAEAGVQVGAQFAAQARDVRRLEATGAHGTPFALSVGWLPPAGGACTR